jgi:hypothetical protein
VEKKCSSNERNVHPHPVKERKFISQIKYVTTTVIYICALYKLGTFYLSDYSVKNVSGVDVPPEEYL